MNRRHMEQFFWYIHRLTPSEKYTWCDCLVIGSGIMHTYSSVSGKALQSYLIDNASDPELLKIPFTCFDSLWVLVHLERPHNVNSWMALSQLRIVNTNTWNLHAVSDQQPYAQGRVSIYEDRTLPLIGHKPCYQEPALNRLILPFRLTRLVTHLSGR